MRFLVGPNWFRRTEAANDDTMVSLLLWDTPQEFVCDSCMFEDVPHLYQFPECLVAVALAMPLKASRLPLAMISRRKCSWTDVGCGTMPLSENDLLYLFK